MLNEKADSLTLLEQIESRDLIIPLIKQINKDAKLSGLDLELAENLLPKQIVDQLNQIFQKLITNDFDGLLNFLYRVDLSEQVLRSIQHRVLEKINEYLTVNVLQREWQKVYFRNKIR
jgi:hypothetical protein